MCYRSPSQSELNFLLESSENGQISRSNFQLPPIHPLMAEARQAGRSVSSSHLSSSLASGPSQLYVQQYHVSSDPCQHVTTIVASLSRSPEMAWELTQPTIARHDDNIHYQNNIESGNSSDQEIGILTPGSTPQDSRSRSGSAILSSDHDNMLSGRTAGEAFAAFDLSRIQKQERQERQNEDHKLKERDRRFDASVWDSLHRLLVPDWFIKICKAVKPEVALSQTNDRAKAAKNAVKYFFAAWDKYKTALLDSQSSISREHVNSNTVDEELAATVIEEVYVIFNILKEKVLRTQDSTRGGAIIEGRISRGRGRGSRRNASPRL